MTRLHFAWFRVTCSTCGQDVTFPLATPAQDQTACFLAEQIHARNDSRQCPHPALSVRLDERDVPLDV